MNTQPTHRFIIELTNGNLNIKIEDATGDQTPIGILLTMLDNARSALLNVGLPSKPISPETPKKGEEEE